VSGRASSVSTCCWPNEPPVETVKQHASPQAFEAEIAPYRAATATIRFPITEPVPLHLVRRIVELLVAENDQS